MANSNGWGDGSVNNNIGWGQGSNNAVGWGKSHLDSWAGATDIDGGNLPSNSVAPAITGTAQEGQTLTCSTGTWSGSPTYTYQWKRNGSNIGSATNSTYTLVTADVGQSIKCTVTATNFVGSATADSNTVTPTSSVDADAQAFITAASITDPTQQSAINNLVIGLKADGLWTKMKAVYPFVGGTATTHKYNLKDPRDLDAAFRIFWSGGITHSTNGVQFGGMNGYGETKLLASTQLGLNSTHVSVYSRTNTDVLAFSIANATGAVNNETSLWLRATNLSYLRVNTPTASTQSTTDSRGTFIGNRNSSTQQQLMVRGTRYDYSVNSNSLNSTTNYSLGGLNGNVFWDTKQYAFASIGDGLTNTDMTNLTTRIDNFQLALNRNV